MRSQVTVGHVVLGQGTPYVRTSNLLSNSAAVFGMYCGRTTRPQSFRYALRTFSGVLAVIDMRSVVKHVPPPSPRNRFHPTVRSTPIRSPQF